MSKKNVYKAPTMPPAKMGPSNGLPHMPRSRWRRVRWSLWIIENYYSLRF